MPGLLMLCMNPQTPLTTNYRLQSPALHNLFLVATEDTVRTIGLTTTDLDAHGYFSVGFSFDYFRGVAVGNRSVATPSVCALSTKQGTAIYIEDWSIRKIERSPYLRCK
jgi:hypothetical protein